jgi:hypothetical protein
LKEVFFVVLTAFLPTYTLYFVAPATFFQETAIVFWEFLAVTLVGFFTEAAEAEIAPTARVEPTISVAKAVLIILLEIFILVLLG